MKLSTMALAIEPSLTRKLFDLAQKYDSVIDLTLGDPDLVTPLNVREAGCRAIMEGKTRYSANAGLQALRETIAAKVSKEVNLPITSSEIIVTVGGMEALFLAMCCLIDRKDEVIISAPYWINYVQMVRMLEGTPVVVNTTAANGFAPTAGDLENAITPRSRMIVVNTPNNPTGEMLDRTTLEEIAAVARSHDLVVLSDEVYRTLIYDNEVHISILSMGDMRWRTVLVDSFSKRFAMTGWRIGYAVAPAEVVANMAKLQENVAACAPLPSQHAVLAGLTSETDTEASRLEFARRRDLIVKGINAIPQLSCRKPRGAFYAFVDIALTGLSSLDFAYSLLHEEQVAVVPGVAYGEAYDHYIRLAFTQPREKLEEGLRRLARFVCGPTSEKGGLS